MSYKFKNIFIIFFLTNLLLVPLCLGESIALSNAGFIKSGIWYSKDPFYSGDKIRIYTVVIDGSGYDLIGDVEFRDNDKLICKSYFAVTAGRNQELWCDWLVTLGNHKITAKIINSKIAPIGESPKPIVLENNITGVSERDVKIAPSLPKGEIKKDTVAREDEKIKIGGIGSSSPIEQKIQSGLDTVQKNFTEIVPDEIKKEDISKATDKILSFIPKTIKESVGRLTASTGLDKLRGPISYVIDFFVAIYKFIVNDSLIVSIILFVIFFSIIKYLYKKIMDL